MLRLRNLGSGRVKRGLPSLSLRISVRPAADSDYNRRQKRIFSVSDSTMFDRIVSDPAILGGKPIIRGTRISVELVLEWMASGASRDEIVARHPQLTVEDIEQAMSFAASSFKNDVVLTTRIST